MVSLIHGENGGFYSQVYELFQLEQQKHSDLVWTLNEYSYGPEYQWRAGLWSSVFLMLENA